MKVLIVIPARYESTRFRGKSLAIIDGLPMIDRVYNQASMSKYADSVVVATDSQLIYEHCVSADINVILTSSKHLTGTDRLVEVSEKSDYEYYINVQGDEPLIEAENIDICIKALLNEQVEIVSLMSRITSNSELISNDTTKVVVDNHGYGMFISRSPIPYPRGYNEAYYKQLGIYGFTKSSLLKFGSLTRSKNEITEEIEFLRFLDNQIKVKFIEVESDSIGVDSPKDLEDVLRFIKKKIEI